MNNVISCQVCGSANTVSVNTYKHKWIYCNLCRSASRQRKKEYLFYYAPRFLFKLFPNLRILLENPEIIADNSKIYDYMATEKHIKRHQDMMVFQNFMTDIIRKYNIDLCGRTILDISGGNGSFIKEFEKYGAVVSMTEYNGKSVDYARKNFHIEAVRFDFNKDSINDLFSQTFDLVFLRAAIMFCADLDKFLDSLKKIIHKNSLIIIYDSIMPSLGTFLRWQLDDYTYLLLYHPEALIKIFKKRDFQLISYDENSPYHYNRDYGVRMRLFNFIFKVYTFFQFPNRDYMQRSSHFIFKYLNDQF